MTLTVKAAAIRAEDGSVYWMPKPARHRHVLKMMEDAGCPKPVKGEHGFVLSDGRFVGRVEAKTIATEAGQLLPRTGKSKSLFSQNVW